MIKDALKFFGTMNKYEITAKLNLREKEWNNPESTLEDVERELDQLLKRKEIGLGMKTLDGVQYYTYRPGK
jgi:hypothetical protein